MSLYLLKELNSLSILEKTFKKYKPANTSLLKFIAFNGPYGNDALLTEFFHKHGISTYSIQHGIFYDYKIQVPYDIINYLFYIYFE